VAGLSNEDDPLRGALAGAGQGLASAGVTGGLDAGYDSLRERARADKLDPTAEVGRDVMRLFGRDYNPEPAMNDLAAPERSVGPALTDIAKETAVRSGFRQTGSAAGSAIGRALAPRPMVEVAGPTSLPGAHRQMYGFRRRVL
jgi:hypothetical protein